MRIFDYIEDDEGKKKAVLNKKETAIAQSKQEMIKQEFQDWIWSDPERRERLCKSYNEKFNSVRPREYDGSQQFSRISSTLHTFPYTCTGRIATVFSVIRSSILLSSIQPSPSFTSQNTGFK